MSDIDKDLYEKWQRSIFINDDPFNIEYPDEISDIQIPSFIYKLQNNLKDLIDKYTLTQIASGLDYIYNNSLSNYPFALRGGPACIEDRVKSIQSIKNLYLECFETQCEEKLAHLSENGNPLNSFCYMIWDVTPIAYIPDIELAGNDMKMIDDAVFDVMEYALSMQNIACIESGLHGLGHKAENDPKASEIIHSFINRSQNIDPRILAYAHQAKHGRIL